jgi:hypothetical protein
LLALGDAVPAPPNVYSALPHPRVHGEVEQRIEHEEVAAALRKGFAKKQKTVE